MLKNGQTNFGVEVIVVSVNELVAPDAFPNEISTLSDITPNSQEKTTIKSRIYIMIWDEVLRGLEFIFRTLERPFRSAFDSLWRLQSLARYSAQRGMPRGPRAFAYTQFCACANARFTLGLSLIGLI